MITTKSQKQLKFVDLKQMLKLKELNGSFQ